MGSGPNQPFYYSLHLLRGRDISTHVLLLHHRDRYYLDRLLIGPGLPGRQA
jgi:hypothetical protein